jgi:hemerythrin-like domain-containing protein
LPSRRQNTPPTRKSACSALAEALAALDRLEHDHEEAEAHHAVVDGLGREWLANDRLSSSDIEQLHRRLTRLQELYDRHIRVEDDEVFPAAARSLNRMQIEEIGGEMAARRNVRQTNPLDF